VCVVALNEGTRGAKRGECVAVAAREVCRLVVEIERKDGCVARGKKVGNGQ